MPTLKELFKQETCWWEKAIILETYHILHEISNTEWHMRDTARCLDCSLGYVSEELMLAKSVRDDESVKNLTRNKALLRVKRC